ncbi:deaminase, partial [Mycobacterium sp. ITM-2017-0098]
MPRTNLSMSISADGYVAGPHQAEANPLGVGGKSLHGWHIGPEKDHPVNQRVVSDMMDGIGATIM